MTNDVLGKKILLVLAPLFLLVFAVISGGIIWSVASNVQTDAEDNLKRIARINETRLNGLLANVRVTVVSTAMAFANLDASARNVRLQGDRLVIAMLDNENVYNAWVAFEPNAFDGKDRAHRDDYLGAPSGRYLRSYTRREDGRGEKLLEDMEEEELNDTTVSAWYTTPRDTGAFYTDITAASLYDYGADEGVFHSVTLSMPIIRNGEVIGVAGCDVLTKDLVQEREQAGGMTSFILSPEDFSVVYAPDNRLVGMPLDKLFFDHFAGIKRAMLSREELFLKTESSNALGEASFMYLKPVDLQDFSEKFVYVSVAMPTGVVASAIYRASLPIAWALFVMLLVFVALFLFVTRYISAPINRLCAAMDAMSAGQMEIRVPDQNKQDEIGVMARALRYMQQQFKMRYAIMRRARKKLDLHLTLNAALYESISFEESLRRMLRVARVALDADMAALMILSIGRSRLFALSGKAGEFNARGLVDGPEFEAHSALAAALQGRDYLLLKAGVQNMPDLLNLADIAPRAYAACVLPIRVEGGILRAYLILESRHFGQSVVHDDDALNFLAARLSCFFMRHEALVENEVVAATRARAAATQPPIIPPAPVAAPVPPPQLSPQLPPSPASKTAPVEPALLVAVCRVPGLDVHHAMSMMGGDAGLYLGLLPVVVRELNGAVEKMADFLAQDDARAFGILVHGIKSALNNVGALELGRAAYELEMAAKADRLEECRQRYSEFARSLRAFSGALAKILDGTPVAVTRGAPKTRGDPDALCVELANIHAALEEYDLTRASERLEYVRQFSYAREKMPAHEAAIDAQLENVAHLLASIEYEEASAAVEHLLSVIREDAP
ncbi:hypothetical protein AGMMS49545_10300 [Betaproteobacteria bacterium]|nr:hypothetical protein AGMMS49545_10300 [Betaproteobacteria bacterium]GHU44330.1 hypothetical protein AGMMS50289_12380 [Betaproteobacteria bacterium]